MATRWMANAAPAAESLGENLVLTDPLTLLEARWASFVAYLPRLAVALVLLLAFWWISRIIGRWERPYRRLSVNPFARSLLQQSVRVGVLLFGILLALDILQATALVGAVLGTAGVAGLAIGFAFKDIVENYIAGVLLSVRQPFAPNDFVEVDGHQGKVVRLTSRATILMTLSGNHLRLPNAMVFKAVILNYTRAPKRRFDFAVGVGVNEDLLGAQRLGLSILAGIEGVLDDPPPSAEVEELGDSSVAMRFYAWIDQRENSYTKTRSEAVRLVKTGFDDAGIEMPEPIYRVVLKEAATAPAAVAAQPVPKVERLPVAATEAKQTQDTSVDDTIERQIADEREQSPQADLLDQEAPQE